MRSTTRCLSIWRVVGARLGCLLLLRQGKLTLALIDSGLQTTRRARHLAHCTGRGSDSDHTLHIAFGAIAFDAVSWGKESVESLDERGVTTEKRRHPVDHSGRVDSGGLAIRFWKPSQLMSTTYTCPLNSFMTSRKRLYTSGWSANWIWDVSAVRCYSPPRRRTGPTLTLT